MRWILFLSVLVHLPAAIFTSKILFVAAPIYSHINSMAIVGDALVARGHEVWVTAMSDLDERLNLKKRSIKITSLASVETFKSHLKMMDDVSTELLKTGKHTLPIDKLNHLITTLITDNDLLAIMEREKFDLVVVDSVPVISMLTILPYKFDVPFIYMGAFCNPYQWRIPFSPAFVPVQLLPFTDNMSFLERLVNTLATTAWAIYDPFSYRNAVAMYAPERPFISMTELQRKASLYLVETNPLLQFPFPTMPNVKKIGSLSPGASTEIPREYATFMDRSKDGVVIVSFGSQFSATETPVLSKLATAFRNTKYNFIIKGSYVKSDDRMMAAKWLPQSALLRHKNVKLFVTHCGANGIGEAIANGVPLLGFPLFAEQPSNAAIMVSKGYGLAMDLFLSKSEDITANINEIISNPRFKTTIGRASEITRELNKRTNPPEEAAFWIDHVIKFGGDYLRSPSVDMPLYQYLLLDVLAFIVVVVTVVLYIVYVIIKACYRKVFNKSRKQKQKRT